MKKNTVRVLRLITVVWLLCIVSSHTSFGYVLKNEEQGTDLSIFGLGMIRFNYASVDGNVGLFEDDDDGFAEEFDTEQFLSLTLEGTLFRDYMLEGYIAYEEDSDEEENAPDWQFRLKLSRDAHYAIIGDQTDIFEEVYFPYYASNFRGITLHAETERFSLTNFGALTRGSLKKQEIKPDGTSGPYLVDEIPVVSASETVTLEIRNRHDQKEVLTKIPQERDVDYTFNYTDGKITFTRPIDPEDFHGDLIFIVVTYRSETESSSFETGLAGVRATVSPAEWVSMGVTYISEFPTEPSVSDGVDIRQEVYGIDSTFKLGQALTLITEYAMSRDNLSQQNSSEDARHAFRAELDSQIGGKVDLSGSYQRAEQDFLLFANPNIEQDQQELELNATYHFRSAQTLEAGYRFWQDNLNDEPEYPVTTTHRPRLRWEADIRDSTYVAAQYEFIRTTDDSEPKTSDQRTHDLLFEAKQEFLQVPLVQKLILTGEYNLTDFEDSLDKDADTLTHYAGIRAKTEPADELAFYVEQRERWIHKKTLGENTQREDISELGMELTRWERLSMHAKYRYQATYDLLEDVQAAEVHTITLRSRFQPWNRLTGTVKFEIRDETLVPKETGDESNVPDIGIVYSSDEWTTDTLTAEGRLLFTLAKGLTARLRYEYEFIEDDTDVFSKTQQDETEFRLN